MLFVFALYVFKNPEIFFNNKKNNTGLKYNNEIIGNLVTRDTDGDTIPDWEESLWGTNPNNRDSNEDGIPDNIEIENLKAQTININTLNSGNITLNKTDQFSQELFSTITALNQAGTVDQETIDKLADSLAENIGGGEARKIYNPTDLKVIKTDTKSDIEKYAESLINIYNKYPLNGSVIDILGRFIVSEDSVDVEALKEFTPIINQTLSLINSLLEIQVPPSIAPLHLNLINALQVLSENLNDIQLYETDTILSLGAISQYDTNNQELQSVITKLSETITNKLNN